MQSKPSSQLLQLLGVANLPAALAAQPLLDLLMSTVARFQSLAPAAGLPADLRLPAHPLAKAASWLLRTPQSVQASLRKRPQETCLVSE